MNEITLNKLRTQILEACAGHTGAPESKWLDKGIEQKAMEFLLTQQLLKRELGDGAKSFVWRLYLTERGRKALNGDIVNKLKEEAT